MTRFILLLISKIWSSLHCQQVDADVQAWQAAAVRRVPLTNARVHGGEVERVSQGSAALAWWSADAESDSQRGRGRGQGGVLGVSQGRVVGE